MSSFPELYEFSEDVQQFAIYKRTIQGCSDKTVNEYMLDLRTFFRYLLAVDNGIDIESDEFVEIDVRPVDAKYLSKVKTEQIYEFLYYAGDSRRNMWSAKARKLSAIKGLYKYLTIKKNFFEDMFSSNKTDGRSIFPCVVTLPSTHSTVREYTLGSSPISKSWQLSLSA